MIPTETGIGSAASSVVDGGLRGLVDTDLDTLVLYVKIDDAFRITQASDHVRHRPPSSRVRQVAADSEAGAASGGLERAATERSGTLDASLAE
jgi:hypothetical protein